jgi:acetyltransferase-like isoleucine patch superfamily enzyme
MMPDLTLWQIIKWEIVRWLIVLTGGVPGIAGIALRYVVLRWFVRGRGFFRVLERVVIEYPNGLSIGRNVGLNTGCWINARGGVTLGDDVILGPYCVIHSANHRVGRLDIPIRNQGYDEAPVYIGNNVWLGAQVIVLPGVTIGDNAVIGAGAVVTHDIPPNAVAAGNPARVIRTRTSDDRVAHDTARI